MSEEAGFDETAGGDLYNTPRGVAQKLDLSSSLKNSEEDKESMRANPFYANCVRILTKLFAGCDDDATRRSSG